MSDKNLQLQLDTVSKKIKQAAATMIDAQGTDNSLLQQTHQNLDQAEQILENMQYELEDTATQNPQFQQAFEKLHDTRQQLGETRQNNNDPLF